MDSGGTYGEQGGRKGGFDIKSVMRLVVDFARIYALQGAIDEANTIKRLEALFQQNPADKDTLKNLAHSEDGQDAMHGKAPHSPLQDGKQNENLGEMPEKIRTTKNTTVSSSHFRYN